MKINKLGNNSNYKILYMVKVFATTICLQCNTKIRNNTKCHSPFLCVYTDYMTKLKSMELQSSMYSYIYTDNPYALLVGLFTWKERLSRQVASSALLCIVLPLFVLF